MMQRIRRDGVVVVDAGSTSVQLTAAMDALGAPLVHVRSLPAARAHDTRVPVSSRYEADLDCSDGTAPLHEFLASTQMRVRGVLAGSDLGVALADTISAELGCKGNDPRTSSVRRHKGEMIRAVAEAGLRTIPTFVAQDEWAAVRWAERYDFDVIVKPAESSASVGFAHVRGRRSVLNAAAAVLSSRNSFGEPNRDLIVQPFVHGQEFAVNAYVIDGVPYFLDAWRTSKTEVDGHILYDFETKVDLRSPDARDIQNYCLQVVAALGIQYGPAHIEVIVEEEGPLMMEVGARLMGSIALSQQAVAYGTSCAVVAAKAAMDQASALSEIAAFQQGSELQLAMVQMLSRQDGFLIRYDLGFMRGLSSFHGVDLYLAAGDRVRSTENSLTSPGLIFLAHQSSAQLEKDHQAIRAAEQRGTLYECTPLPDGEGEFAAEDDPHWARTTSTEPITKGIRTT